MVSDKLFIHLLSLLKLVFRHRMVVNLYLQSSETALAQFSERFLQYLYETSGLHQLSALTVLRFAVRAGLSFSPYSSTPADQRQ